MRSVPRPYPASLRDSLAHYVKQICTYVDADYTTRKGETDYVFSDTVQDNLFQQAVSQLLKDGSALMVTLGSDIGEIYNNHVGKFLATKGPSAASVVACYNQFAFWEGSELRPNPYCTKQLSDAGLLPFVNAFPWFTKRADNWYGARRLLEKYLNLTKPYIILAYGGVVSFYFHFQVNGVD